MDCLSETMFRQLTGKWGRGGREERETEKEKEREREREREEVKGVGGVTERERGGERGRESDRDAYMHITYLCLSFSNKDIGQQSKGSSQSLQAAHLLGFVKVQ